jgi:hypothetical protein
VMDFDYRKIPSIENAFRISHFPLTDFKSEEIRIFINQDEYSLFNFPSSSVVKFEPHKGWVGHIEL